MNGDAHLQLLTCNTSEPEQLLMRNDTFPLVWVQTLWLGGNGMG